MCDNNYDVIALSETLLSGAINDDEICMEGYEVFRLDRTRHGGGGGGVALHCRTELQCNDHFEFKILMFLIFFNVFFFFHFLYFNSITI